MRQCRSAGGPRSEMAKPRSCQRGAMDASCNQAQPSAAVIAHAIANRPNATRSSARDETPPAFARRAPTICTCAAATPMVSRWTGATRCEATTRAGETKAAAATARAASARNRRNSTRLRTFAACTTSVAGSFQNSTQKLKFTQTKSMGRNDETSVRDGVRHHRHGPIPQPRRVPTFGAHRARRRRGRVRLREQLRTQPRRGRRGQLIRTRPGRVRPHGPELRTPTLHHQDDRTATGHDPSAWSVVAARRQQPCSQRRARCCDRLVLVDQRSAATRISQPSCCQPFARPSSRVCSFDLATPSTDLAIGAMQFGE